MANEALTVLLIEKDALIRVCFSPSSNLTNLEDFSIFDAPEELNDENKSSKLIKVPDGEAQKMFSRCPHTQCGHVFETVNEVNNHIIFRHVTEPAVSKAFLI